MKHNIEIKNNILTLRVQLEIRSTDPSSKIRFGMPSVYKLVSEAKLPNNTKLGRCISPVLGLDNSFQDRLEGAWKFELITALEKTNSVEEEVAEKQPTTQTKKTTRKPRRSKTARKK